MSGGSCAREAQHFEIRVDGRAGPGLPKLAARGPWPAAGANYNPRTSARCCSRQTLGNFRKTKETSDKIGPLGKHFEVKLVVVLSSFEVIVRNFCFRLWGDDAARPVCGGSPQGDPVLPSSGSVDVRMYVY